MLTKKKGEREVKLKWVKKILTLTLAFSVFMGEAAVGPMQVYAAASEISTLEESEEATSQQPEEKAEDGEETPETDSSDKKEESLPPFSHR